jgi:hypothetical protein
MSKQKLTDRQFLSGVTLADLLHFVVTGDTSQNPAGSSYKGTVEQLFNTFSSFTCTYPLIVDTVNSCSGSITINGNVTINGSATTINTQIIQSQDNNIVLNYSGTHLTAIGGGITVEDGQSDGVDSSIFTDSNGTWLFDPGLSASTGSINNFTADTISVTTIGGSGDCVNDIYVSNIHSCSPLNINPLDEGNVYFGSNSGVTIDVTNSRIGIGTNSPSEKLDVSGNTKISGTLNIGTILSGTPQINLGIDSNGFVVTGVTTIDTNTFTTGATLNGTILEFDRTDTTNAYNVDLISLQFTGNTSGNCITDLYVSNLYGCSPITVHDTIELVNGIIDTSGSTGGQLQLKYNNNPNEVMLSNDSGNYSDEFVYLSPSYVAIQSTRTGGGLIDMFADEYNAGFRLGGDGTGGLEKFRLYAPGLMFKLDDFPSGIDAGYGVLYLNTTQDRFRLGETPTQSVLSFATNGGSIDTIFKPPQPSSIISSQGSQINPSVFNTVVLGGSGMTANQNNTVYVDNLNIKTLGTGTSVNNLGIDSNGFVVTGVTTPIGLSKYSASIPFTGGSTQTITHNLNDTDVVVQLKDSTGKLIIPDEINNYTSNTVDIKVSSTETYRVIIIG